MTLTGTNTYIVCSGSDAVVIDPGPAIERHLDAIVAECAARDVRIAAIALTHGHPDHAPAAALLAQRTASLVYAHPSSEVPHDRDLDLDGTLRAGAVSLNVMDAPGHTFEHVVFYEPTIYALFTGDVILGEGSVVIAPPGGAMRPYQRTLARLRNEFKDARTIYGGHGPRVDDAQAKIAEYIAHRSERERELLSALQAGPQTIPELVLRIYGRARTVLWPAMARQMLAYLIALQQEERVRATVVDRPLNAEETAILNPPWEAIVGPEHAALVRAELGAMLHLDVLYRYELIRNTIFPN